MPFTRRGVSSDAAVAAVIFLAYFLVISNITLVLPLLSFMRHDLQLSAYESGMILAAFPALSLAGNIAIGPFIDKLGRRRFLIVGALGCALTFLLTAISSSGLLISASRAATGIVMPMISASVFAAVADYFPARERTRVTGYVSAASPVAHLLAMPLGILMGGALSWRAPFLAFAACFIALAAGIAVLPKPRYEVLAAGAITGRTYRHRLVSFSERRETRRAITAYFIFSAAVFVFLGLYPTWVMAQAGGAGRATTIVELFLFGGLFGVAGAVLSGGVARRFHHPLRVCALAAMGTAVVTAAVPILGGNVLSQAICYAAFSFGRALLLPVLIATMMLLVPSTERGSLNGLLNATFHAASAIGGIVSAWLYDWSPSFGANAVVTLLLLVATAISLWRLSRHPATDGAAAHPA